MTRLLHSTALVLALLVASSGARADDEGSEHTAQLVGDSADTLGVSVRHGERQGWWMDYRPRPGARSRELALPFLPADHAHYWVLVPRGRSPVVFVMSSREQLTGKTDAIWVVGADGALLKRWSLGELLSAAELAKVRRSVSHSWWLEGPPVLNGSGLALDANGVRIEVDLRKLTLRRDSAGSGRDPTGASSDHKR